MHRIQLISFFFNDTATTEIYTLSLHDALPISRSPRRACGPRRSPRAGLRSSCPIRGERLARLGRRSRSSCRGSGSRRSEEHTSELQSRQYLVCRLLLEKKKKPQNTNYQLVRDI